MTRDLFQYQDIVLPVKISLCRYDFHTTVIFVSTKEFLYQFGKYSYWNGSEIFTLHKQVALNPILVQTSVRFVEVFYRLPNYDNPICCVATVCHQVHCMYWGHLGHFHRATSHLKWLFVWDIKPVHLVPRHFLSRFIVVWAQNLTVFMFMYVNIAPNSSGNMQKHGYLGCFHAASTRENVFGVW